MAGYLSNGVCWQNQTDAADALFQNAQPAFTTYQGLLGSSVSIHDYYQRAATGEWFYVHDIYNSSFTLVNHYVKALFVPIFASCELPNDPTTNFITGVELGWAVATVMIIVFAIRRSYRGF